LIVLALYALAAGRSTVNPLHGEAYEQAQHKAAHDQAQRKAAYEEAQPTGTAAQQPSRTS